ncbi:MAG TPA: cell division protein FtsZ [Rhodospirillales bacterium]
MAINLKVPDIRELKPHLVVFGVGGAGGNAVNNMITAGLSGVDFVCANTDAQALTTAKAERVIQMGVEATQGLGAGSHPEVGRAAAEEAIDEIRDHLSGAHMVFVTAGMGGGTGTGAAPVIARVAKEIGLLTVGVITKPFHFEGQRRMRIAENGIQELAAHVDTLIVIPNQNLFRVANEKTTFADAFAMADQVLYSGVACITDLMVKEGLINLDFADVRAVMREMGKAMMGTGEASGEKRAIKAAEAAISNPLLDEVSMRGARGLLISITGGKDLTLYEVDEAASRIREEVDPDANIILGATFDQSLEGLVRVSVVATGIDPALIPAANPSAVERISDPIARQRIQRSVETRRELPRPSMESMREHAYHAPADHEDDGYDELPPLAHETAIDDVTIRPVAAKPTFFEPVFDEPRAHDPIDEPERPYIPPRAEQPVRGLRMPRVEELPMPAQNEIRASRGEPSEHHSAEKRRTTLLQRLANVGLGRREEEEAPAPRPVARPPSRPVDPDPRPAAERRTADQVSEYARRPASRSLPLDLHGRAPGRPADDDELEIPAFLRRQAN